ncbi:MAG TPA: hypothetical protein VN175_10655 [Rhizomicrobium sp.]|jgi:hypothetical protein|nr:hypothetical protein [Rhizomicrobium sp.]
MTTLATDPLTLIHTAISLLAIVTGLLVLAAMMKGQTPVPMTGIFLGLTVLTSVTGYLFPNAHVTPAMIVGAISLIVLAVALFALYGRHLAGRWRTIYVITATMALYLNVFVLVVQSFIKVPPLHAVVPAVPPAGPVFGAVQGVVLLAFVAAGWRAVKARA